MQRALADAYPQVQETYAEAGDVLGYDLWRLVQDGPQDELDNTVVTQPAMLAAGVAAWRCWLAAGGALPAQCAGHSLGEYSALVAAGALSFQDAAKIVQKRADLMQGAVPAGEGAMAAILGLDDEAVEAVCREAEQGQVVRAVNFNSPGQVVIAGDRDAVQRAAELAKTRGAKRALLLRVSVPSHSPLMQPAAEALSAHLAATAFEVPALPVISNVDVQPYTNAEQIRLGLQQQVYNPVQWTATVRHMLDQGVDMIFECGPGKVLAGLAKRIDRSVTCIPLEDPEGLEKALAASRATADS